MQRRYTRIFLMQELNIVIDMLRVLLLSAFILLLTINGFTQPLTLPPKIFTMKQSRISIGFGLEYGPRLSYFTESEQYKIKVQQIIYYNSEGELDTLGFNFGIGLGIEWFSPFSIIGFHNEVNYHTIDYRYSFNGSANDYKIDYIEVPLCLKLKFGGALRKSHFITMVGTGYILPINVRYTNPPNEEYKDKDRVNNGWEYIGAIGFDTTFGRIPNSEVKDLARAVGILKFTYRPDPFNTTTPDKIFVPIENNNLHFTDYFITGCLQWYF